MTAIETIEREGFTIELHYDEGAADMSPREWSNCSILAQLSSDFLQPDERDSRADALIEAWERYGDPAKVERYARSFLDAVAVEWWDDPQSSSRIVGIIDRDTAKREQLTDPADNLKIELRYYAAWADGEVYYWTITGPDGQSESCGGYIGEPEYALSEAKSIVDSMIAERHEQRADMYRRLVNAS